LKDRTYILEAWRNQYEDLRHSYNQLLQDFAKYIEVTNKNFKIPDIRSLVENPVTVDPYKHPVSRGVTVTAVDRHYITFPRETWTQILGLVHSEVKKEIPRWIAELSDCDDVADAVYTCTRMAFIKAGTQYNGAVAWARSRTHAYNAVLTSDEGWWIYEPQTGRWVGSLGELIGEDPYSTIQVRV